MLRPANGVLNTEVNGDTGPHARVGMSSSSPGRTDMRGDYRRTGPTHLTGVLKYLRQELRGEKACQGRCGLAPPNGEDVNVRLGAQGTKPPRTSLDLFIQ